MQRNCCSDKVQQQSTGTARSAVTVCESLPSPRADAEPSIDPVAFEAICANCATLAVRFECLEYAPDDTPVLCGNCGRQRGLVGAVRQLAHLALPGDLSSAPIVVGRTDE
jgi:hypothetical protein